jgi:threonine aldolase
MIQEKICLVSDNFVPVHPVIMEAIFDANKGYAPSYGSDSCSEEAQQPIKTIF